MQQLICDGCQKTEDARLADKQLRIRPVEIELHEDKRDFPDTTLRFKADLCPQCWEFILKTFFRQQIEGEPSITFDHELPEFMNHPTEMQKELTLAN